LALSSPTSRGSISATFELLSLLLLLLCQLLLCH
jgi:hypothetical protein